MQQAPELEVDLFADDVIAEPWETYRTLRATAPVVRVRQDLYDVYAVSRHADVRRVLKNWQTFVSSRGHGFNEFRNRGTGVSSLDPPEHTQTRSVLLRGLKPSRIAGLQGMMEATAKSLVAGVTTAGNFDAITDLVEPYVIAVIGQLVGLQEDLAERYGHSGSDFFNTSGPANERFHASLPIVRELYQVMDELARDDLVEGSLGWDLFGAAERHEVPAQVGHLLSAYLAPAFDTTIAGLGSAIWLLSTHPNQWSALRNDPSLALAAFQEAIRLESPIQIWGRACAEGCEFEGVAIPPETRLAVVIGSANRDERHYTDPDRFDIRRDTSDSVAFGFGIHTCLGAPLARAEAVALLTTLAEHAPVLTPAGEPTRRLNNVTRGLARLPLAVG